jgi:signal transduction histidine kinase
MKLRDRFVLTLFGITLILIAPALYGLIALQELRDVAQNLRSRDAVGALALGRLQSAFRAVESDERIYLALASGPERAAVQGRVGRGMEQVEAELSRLSKGGYPSVVRPAVAAWRSLDAAIAQEQRLVENGQVEAADARRSEVVDPAFGAMEATLEPIGLAINQVGAAEVRRAQSIATRASTTALTSLAVALAIALAIGGWLARGILRPIHGLRTGMAAVAAGDFNPELAISPERKDEIGELARSFQWMTGQLRELERLRAQVVAVASHELKTPLSVIKGYVSLVREGIYGDVTEEQKKVLTSVSDQADRLARLIQQLLDVSRFEAGGGRLDIEQLDLRAFLLELSVSFEALAVQNQIEFQVDIDADLPNTLHGDPDRLNEVVGNLLSNAFKFTPRKGKIALRARPGARHDDHQVVIEVTDTGVGIPEDQLGRVFEKFYQVENEAQPMSVGSGLGLAISKEIVEAHGGTITAESEVGKGTTFRVLLPVANLGNGGGSPTPRSR